MATTFFYFGSISLDFVFHLFFLFVIFFYFICFKFYQSAKPLHFFNSMRYSRMLEESSFANKKADYFWLLLQSSVMLLVNIHSRIPSVFNLTLFVFSSKKKRYYHRYLTSLFYPHLWLSFPSTFGHGDIPQRLYLSSACSQLQHLIYP